MTASPGRVHSERIVLVIATLAAGGAERVMTLLAGEWARRGRPVTIITLGSAATDHYKLPSGVDRIALDVLKSSHGKFDAVKNNVIRLRKLRRAIALQRPGAVISFMDATNVLTLMATRGLRVPVIVSERIDPRHYPIARGWNWLRSKLYPRAAAVVTQTHSVAEWTRSFVPRENVHVIPNPVDVPLIELSEADSVPQDPIISAMGRLDPQKGFDLLLEAFARVPSEFGARLIILGEGAERENLTRLAQSLAIKDRVTMPGRVADPFPILKQTSLFVLSSRFEGFPNALLEAMALGLPVISFDCPSGPADIIADGENGILVEPDSVDSLSNTITQLLADEQLRKRLGAAAKKSVNAYSLKTITDEWEQLL